MPRQRRRRVSERIGQTLDAEQTTETPAADPRRRTEGARPGDCDRATWRHASRSTADRVDLRRPPSRDHARQQAEAQSKQGHRQEQASVGDVQRLDAIGRRQVGVDQPAETEAEQDAERYSPGA